MGYYDYLEQRKAVAHKRFKDHKATVVQSDDKFSILDWRHIFGENSYYPDKLTDLMEKYNPDWWESDFVDVGKRIDQRVVLWAVGYQMALQQIQG